MAPIKMPATPRSAYNPKRPANALLLTHVYELEKAVIAAGRKVRRKKPQTEEQVAAYIRHLNRALHQQVLLPAMKRRPLDVPLADPSPAPSRRKRPVSRTRAAASVSRLSRRTKRSPSRTRKRSRRS